MHTHKKGILRRHKTQFQIFPGSSKIPGALRNILSLSLFFQSTQLFIKLMAARFISGIRVSNRGVQNDKQYLCLFSALTLNYRVFCMHFKNMLMASGEDRQMHH